MLFRSDDEADGNAKLSLQGIVPYFYKSARECLGQSTGQGGSGTFSGWSLQLSWWSFLCISRSGLRI